MSSVVGTLLLISWICLSGVQGLDLLYPGNKEIG